ncbi:REP element-mobilizing transposase RayT [Flavobacterium sp. 2755]|uniref:transposase n=1 Tax=Flavobacterium sp. 2755 TaxID=2817765 RepID=UPI002855D8C6|nr:transposase [Flavobacterium sp. 2755]MDR6763577.1 REP element-mobilizing transposase RayT [Flavobacterium sp. 2755]
MTLYKDKLKIDSNRLRDWDYSSEAVYFITMVTKDRECIFGSVEDGKMILNENGKIVENELLKSIKIRKNWFFHNWIVMPNHIHLLIEIQGNMEKRIETPHIKTSQISTSRIVETHSSASTSGISTKNEPQSLSTTFAETHCCASLQNQSLSKSSNESNLNVPIKTSHIVETHSSASTSGISTTNETQSLSTTFAETHCCAPLQNKSLQTFSRKPNSISSFVAVFKSVTIKQINGFESIWQQNYHDHIVRNYKTFETIYDYIKNNPISWDTDSINSQLQ